MSRSASQPVPQRSPTGVLRWRHVEILTVGLLGITGAVILLEWRAPGSALVIAAAVVAIATAGVVMARRTHRLRRRTTTDPRPYLDDESGHRHEDILHQIRAGLGGVRAVIDLLGDDGPELLPDSARAKLLTLAGSELARLSRIAGPAGAPGSVAALAAETRLVVLDDVLSGLAITASLTGQAVRYHACGLRTRVRSDVLIEVVGGLLTNARVHAPGAAVDLSAGREDGRIVVRVSDAGPGVPPGLAQGIFLRGVHSDASPGEGLGLYLSRRLMREHGGDVQLQPSVTGTRFAVLLPRAHDRPVFEGHIPAQRVGREA